MIEVDGIESDVLPDSPLELIELIDAATNKLASARLQTLSEDELLSGVEVFERAHRRGDGVDAQLLIEVSDRGAYRKVGCLSPATFLEQWMRLGSGPGKRRRDAAAKIGRMTNMQGEQVDPVLPGTADAVADGASSIDHVLEIESIMDRIPHRVPADIRAEAEAQLAQAARELAPRALNFVGARLLAHLDPDGELTDDVDRKRTRGFSLQAQDRRLMSKVRACLKPELRAKLESLLVLWAAPGMNNPDDPDSPFGASSDADPAALAGARERDDRTSSQRGHDALEAMCEYLIGHGGLGKPSSLPAHLVITTSLENLEKRSGVAHTATGARVPVRDLVELAATATPWLEVFADHSTSILYLGRGRRLASLQQRLAIFGRDRGCTAPNCTVPFVRTEAHHLPDWQHGGPTDIDHLGGACGGHNRRVSTERGGWETIIIPTGPYEGRVGWRPTGTHQSWQVNHAHQPERILDGQRDGRLDGPRPDVGETGTVGQAPQVFSRSRIERWLTCRMPAPPPPGPAPPDGVEIIANPLPDFPQ
ncbi:HNH endonuclease signature motif containing protein [Gordonia zhaorongruii]|uniref:HNH endonuclease signature motif containing protein n=1 Tax=Gordonia zhaorongruii TaxID=2597659 RepID=UPI001FCFA7CA|nr:HNH endonuclease signature motif containing protein [Gordonia zhaorongruii]